MGSDNFTKRNSKFEYTFEWRNRYTAVTSWSKTRDWHVLQHERGADKGVRILSKLISKRNLVRTPARRIWLSDKRHSLDQSWVPIYQESERINHFWWVPIRGLHANPYRRTEKQCTIQCLQRQSIIKRVKESVISGESSFEAYMQTRIRKRRKQYKIRYQQWYSNRRDSWTSFNNWGTCGTRPESKRA